MTNLILTYGLAEGNNSGTPLSQFENYGNANGYKVVQPSSKFELADDMNIETPLGLIYLPTQNELEVNGLPLHALNSASQFTKQVVLYGGDLSKDFPQIQLPRESILIDINQPFSNKGGLARKVFENFQN